MGRNSPSERRRTKDRKRAARQDWYQAYRRRMREGLEICRTVGCGRLAVTFAHLRPHRLGGSYTPLNVTLCCEECNQGHGDMWITWMLPLVKERYFLHVVQEYRRVSKREAKLARRVRTDGRRDTADAAG